MVVGFFKFVPFRSRREADYDASGMIFHYAGESDMYSLV